jgi:CheY-like chemotaxis protein
MARGTVAANDPTSNLDTVGDPSIIVAIDDAAENLSLGRCRLHLPRSRQRRGGLDVASADLPAAHSSISRCQTWTGLETCRRIRNDLCLKHVPIAFLTARKTTDDVRNGMAVEGNDFIVKPFDAAKLLERLNYWTQHRVNKG